MGGKPHTPLSHPFLHGRCSRDAHRNFSKVQQKGLSADIQNLQNLLIRGIKATDFYEKALGPQRFENPLRIKLCISFIKTENILQNAETIPICSEQNTSLC